MYSTKKHDTIFEAVQRNLTMNCYPKEVIFSQYFYFKIRNLSNHFTKAMVKLSIWYIKEKIYK